VPLDRDSIVALSEPQEVWYFNLSSPPEKGNSRTLDVEFTKRGRWNAVLFWYTLHLGGGVEISTGPEALSQPGESRARAQGEQ
jgi:protein arginine N-methyltransferase 7